MAHFSIRALCAGCIALCAPVAAQQAPQVTPRDLRPELPAPPPTVLPAPAPAAVPAEAENLFVTLADVAVADGYPRFAAATEAIVARVRGRRVAAAEFYRLAGAVEALYQDAGYLLVRVVVPPQELKDGGTLRLAVLDGFIEHVDLAAVPERARPLVAKTMAGLVDRKGITAGELERALTLAGRGPGLVLRSTLAPGTTAGGSVLVLDGQHEVFAASLSADNRLSHALGPWQATLQLRANQPFGRGEQAYAYVSAHPDLGQAFGSEAPRRVAGGGFLIPVGSDGWTLNPEFTWSSTLTPGAQFVPRTRSGLRRGTLRAVYPLLLDRSQELTFTGSFEASTQVTEAPDFQSTLNQDRLRVGRVALDWSRGIAAAGQLRLSGTLSKGTHGLGARTQADADASGIALSRVGADPAFAKIEAAAVYDHNFPWLRSRTTLRAQRALGSVLPSSELFSLDGEDALSTFTSGAISDDGGWTLRQEFARSFAAGGDNGFVFVPYVFGAVGKPTSKLAGGAARGTSSAHGLGLRTTWRTLALALEYGKRKSRPSDLDGGQLFAKVQVQF